jgi:accessory colonization factor AcfC
MKRMLPVLVIAAFLFGLPAGTMASETLRAYGPGGPLPAMKEAAEEFGKLYGIAVEVTAGPTGNWLDKAKQDADLIFSGAEYMMTDFIKAMEGRIDESTVESLYLRPSAILVRPGNPKQIRRFEDLLKSGIKVLVVQGAGQAALWEDMAGRKGDIRTVRALRKNIVNYAVNSAEAKKAWTVDKALDAWIIWNIWQIANKDLADLVPVNKDYRIYRDCGISLTQTAKEKDTARNFVAFLKSDTGRRIFAKWGWITKQSQ